MKRLGTETYGRTREDPETGPRKRLYDCLVWVIKIILCRQC